MEKTNYIKHMFKKHIFAVLCVTILIVFACIYFFNKAIAVQPTQVQKNFALGLNDATYSGSFNQSGDATFTVMVDGKDVPLLGYGCIYIDGVIGTFNNGDIITGASSHATAEVNTGGMRCAMGGGMVSPVYLINVSGTFQLGEEVDSSSGGTAAYDSDTITYPEGGTDTISWTEVGGSGGSGIAVPINNLSVSLADGIQIDFGSATGHTLSDYWTYTITAGQTQTQTSILQDPGDLDDGVYSGIFSEAGGAVFTTTIDGVDVEQSGSGYICLIDPTGDFNNGDTVLGETSGATAEVGGVPGMCGMFRESAVPLINVVGEFDARGEIVSDITSSVSGTYDVVFSNISYPRPTDTYSWTEVGGSGGSGANIPLDTDLPFVANLADGISITFGATIGHTLGDSWVYTITSNNNPLPPQIPVISGVSSGATVQSRYASLLKIGEVQKAKELKEQFPNASEQLTNNNVLNSNVIENKNNSGFVFTGTLVLGMRNVEVKELQKLLNKIGYTISKTGNGSPGKETSRFGKLTERAIIKFQKDNGLFPDGIVGPKTKAKLIELAGN